MYDSRNFLENGVVVPKALGSSTEPIRLSSVGMRAESLLERVGSWTAQRSYWTVVALGLLVVLAKTGFKWAGTTGEGWYVEFQDVIDSWPLKEGLAIGDQGRALYQENYSSILLFRLFDAIGFPASSVTWMLVHWAVTAVAILLLILWAKRTYGEEAGRLVMLLVIFGSATIVLLQEIGRYDAPFFLGAVLVAVSRNWLWVTLGVVLLATSSWTMGFGLAAGFFLSGLVLRSLSLSLRGAGVLLGCLAGAGFLMWIRILVGGDPALGRLGFLTPGGSSESVNPLYLAWWNIVQPFPNWIWAALGVSWFLLALVLLQITRYRILLILSMTAIPILAGLINGGDGTREYALTLTAILVAVATFVERRAHDQPVTSRPHISNKALGLVVIACVITPVINVNPHVILNPWGWIGLYGLDLFHSIVG